MKKGIILLLALMVATSTACKSTDQNEPIEPTTEVNQETEVTDEVLPETTEPEEETSIPEEKQEEEVEDLALDETVVDIEGLAIFDIPKGKEHIKTSTFTVLNSYNAFSVTWDGEREHVYYKLYASNSEDGNYGYIKDIEEVDPETTGMLNYSVTLENFNLNSNVYLKITSVTEKGGDEIEEPYGPILHYASKSANELTNDELTHHLTSKYPLISSEDQTVAFRFYNRYLIEEDDQEIKIISNLKGDYIQIFEDAMDSKYRDEIVQKIEDVYLYAYEIRQKKVVGIIEDKMTITINDPEHIEIDLK